MSARSEEELRLSKDVSTCTFKHFKYFAVGMLLGLPLSVKSKSYWPFTFAAIAGSALDYMEAQKNCKPQQDALNACIARQREDSARFKSGLPPESNFPPESSWQPHEKTANRRQGKREDTGEVVRRLAALESEEDKGNYGSRKGMW